MSRYFVVNVDVEDENVNIKISYKISISLAIKKKCRRFPCEKLFFLKASIIPELYFMFNMNDECRLYKQTKKIVSEYYNTLKKAR